jgi:hypothetical protein
MPSSQKLRIKAEEHEMWLNDIMFLHSRRRVRQDKSKTNHLVQFWMKGKGVMTYRSPALGHL